MTWGVNFGLDNVTNAVNMAKSIVKAFGSAAVQQAQVTLDMIEVGGSYDPLNPNTCSINIMLF